jgi:hypothetical protein
MQNISAGVLFLIDALKSTGRKLTYDEYANMRINSYEQKLLHPFLDDKAFITLVEYYLSNSGQDWSPMGEFELSKHYGDAMQRELIHQLIKRFKEKIQQYNREKYNERSNSTDTDS